MHYLYLVTAKKRRRIAAVTVRWFVLDKLLVCTGSIYVQHCIFKLLAKLREGNLFDKFVRIHFCDSRKTIF